MLSMRVGRGGVYVLYRNHSDYRIINTGPPDKMHCDFSYEMQVSRAFQMSARVHLLQ